MNFRTNIIQVNDQYYILAASSYADDRTRVLNHADTFAVFDRWGDIHPIGQGVQGLYHQGTRFLSDFEFRLNGTRPLLLSSTIKEDNDILSADLTNSDIKSVEDQDLSKGSVHIEKNILVRDGICYESILLTNYSQEETDIEVSFTANSDFKDIFEVRGMAREKRGEIYDANYEKARIELSYKGLDDITRRTELHFSPQPSCIKNDHICYNLKLKGQEQYRIQCYIYFVVGEKETFSLGDPDAMAVLSSGIKEKERKFADIFTSHEQFNHWINRSKADVSGLLAKSSMGEYPFAGVPWYNTAFGRDGIITAMETLWADPEITKNVLLYLARTQATEEDAFRDAEPGKIFHESRGGEMAELGEIPFKLYYGTVDATPLFVVLAGEYLKRSGDADTIKKIWPNIRSAIKWCDEYGDLDGDGFVEYQHKSERGLTNQCWKDSFDSVMYEDGTLADPPIAMCEVQGYVYDAKLKAAEMAEEFGEDEFAEKLKEEAGELKRRFNEMFWDEELGTFVLALAKGNKPCRVKSSNVGHCLMSGIVDEKYADKVVKVLLGKEMYSGWGVRTLGSAEKRYNPMSYHNGSIWPHDTAMVAAGLAKYGFREGVLKITRSLFDASIYIDLQRLPELYCGFDRRVGEGPTSYPVACSPQAWSVSVVFLLIKSFLRMEINARDKIITFNDPCLPEYLQFIHLDNVKLGDGFGKFRIFKEEGDVKVLPAYLPEGWKVTGPEALEVVEL